jgi:hypothetical protein
VAALPSACQSGGAAADGGYEVDELPRADRVVAPVPVGEVGLADVVDELGQPVEQRGQDDLTGHAVIRRVGSVTRRPRLPGGTPRP